VPSGEDVACLACGAAEARLETESRAQMHDAREVFRFVRCAACDLVRLSPRVPAARVARYYDETYLPHRGPAAWGRYAPFVARAQAATDRARVRRVAAEARLDAAARVLDVGCGLPTFLRELRDSTRVRATGVDFAEDAWRLEPERWTGLELVHGTVHDAPLTPGFDAITMWHALEHEYDPVGTLKRLKSLANPGGVLVVEVPDVDSLTRRLHGPDWAGWHTPRHTAAYSAKALADVLARAGWRVTRQLRHGTLDPYVLWWLGRQERLGRSVRGDLAERFVPFVLGRIAAAPLLALQRWIRLGVQTAIAVRDP
jgi:2-polyprenyl-3-methyl-5-hydroxy-6-metoxy-1,4-benzoquinol methylase